jgi:hypothetical protein
MHTGICVANNGHQRQVVALPPLLSVLLPLRPHLRAVDARSDINRILSTEVHAASEASTTAILIIQTRNNSVGETF